LVGCATSSLSLAPPAPNVPWTPATRADGEIIASQSASPAAPRSDSYVLPSNPKAAAEVAPGPDVDKSHAYTLAELIDLSQSSNPLTRAAWENARSAALAAGIAKTAYLPSLTASVIGAYQTGNNRVTAYGTGGNLNGSVHGSISALSAQWLLFDFGERDATVAAAEQVSVIANIGFTAAHQQLIYRVALAYDTHMAARARLSTAEKALRNAKQVQEAAESRYAHGVGTVVEVAQARQGTAQEELAQVRPAARRKTAMWPCSQRWAFPR
jgi:outer membrane protein